jgi:hypothetical protein
VSAPVPAATPTAVIEPDAIILPPVAPVEVPTLIPAVAVKVTDDVKAPPVTANPPPVPAKVAGEVPETVRALPAVFVNAALCPVITVVAEPKVPLTTILVIVAVVTDVKVPAIEAPEAVSCPALERPYVCVAPT